MNSIQREGIAVLFVRGKVQQRSTKLTPRLDSVSLAVVRSSLVLGVLFDMVDNRESAYCILPFLSALLRISKRLSRGNECSTGIRLRATRWRTRGMPGYTATYTLPPLTDLTVLILEYYWKIRRPIRFLGRNDKLKNANELVSNGFRNFLLRTLYD